MTPRLSVCIPTYNAASFLPDAIRSVLSQSFRDYELIIVDNASTDGTDRIVASFSDARIRYYRNTENIGAPANGNRCLEYATGQYIKFLCADDALLPGLLNKQVEILDASPSIGLVTCDMYVTDENLQNRRLARFYPGRWEGTFVVRQSLNAIQNHIGGPSNVMLRRSAIGDLRVDLRYHWVGDLAFYCHILSRSDYGNIDEPGVLYRRHPGAASNLETSSKAKAAEEYTLIRELNGLSHVNSFKLMRRNIGPGRRIAMGLWLVRHCWDIGTLRRSIREYRESVRIFAL